MHKIGAALAVIFLFGGYAVYTHVNTDAAFSASSAITAASAPAAPAPHTRVSQPVVADAPTPAKKGRYLDGTYTGSSADAYYGYVQVRVTIANGLIKKVAFLSYPNDRDTSRMINQDAMPRLSSEAIAAQSANVSGVSGATDTSQAFEQSLASALSQAA